MTDRQILDLTWEELKTKSENLIIIYEHLKQIENSSLGIGNVTKTKGVSMISDLELRKLMSESQPTVLNANTMYQNNDTLSKNLLNSICFVVVANEIEDFINTQKVDFVLSHCTPYLNKLHPEKLKSIFNKAA